MKKIQKAAQEYTESLHLVDSDDLSIDELAEKTRADFFAGAKFAQRWIPVKEELPPSEKVVLCKYAFEGEDAYTAAAYYAEHKMWITPMHLYDPDIEYNPEFWRPIEIE